MKNDLDFDGVSLEAWMRKMLREGYTEIVANVLRLLPEEKKKKYRDVWIEEMANKKKERENGNR